MVAVIATRHPKTMPNPPKNIGTTSCAGILETEQKLKLFMGNISQLGETARESAAIEGEHEADVLNECQQALDVLATLASAFQELRWTLMEHNADYAKVLPETYDTVSDLIDGLKD